MAKKQFHAFARSSMGLTMCAALIFSGCSSPEEAVPEEPEAVPEQVFRIGGSLSAPGLLTGTDPNNVDGAEVDVASRLVEYLTVDDAGVSAHWVPVVAGEIGASFLEEELDLVIGQFSDADLDPTLGWVGPYATAQAAVLVHQSTEAVDATSQEVVFPFNVVDGVEDLAAARVCVVADSIAARVELPVGEAFLQQSLTECEIGMRSGRFDAVAADDVQLAGLLLDPVRQEAYDVLFWSQFDDEAYDIAEELMVPQRYWVGTSPDQCAVVQTGLRSMIIDGVLEELFEPYDISGVVELQSVRLTDVTTRHCDE